MKIPKRIENLIDKRTKLAQDLNSVDLELTNWIDKHNVEVESYDYCSGCEMYANPSASGERIKQAILKTE
jgi:hypothetical protein